MSLSKKIRKQKTRVFRGYIKKPVALNRLSEWKPKHRKVDLTFFLVWLFPFPHVIKKISSKFLSELTLSWRRCLLYRNQYIDLENKSMDWFLYNRNLHYERDNVKLHKINTKTFVEESCFIKVVLKLCFSTCKFI